MQKDQSVIYLSTFSSAHGVIAIAHLKFIIIIIIIVINIVIIRPRRSMT